MCCWTRNSVLPGSFEWGRTSLRLSGSDQFAFRSQEDRSIQNESVCDLDLFTGWPGHAHMETARIGETVQSGKSGNSSLISGRCIQKLCCSSSVAYSPPIAICMGGVRHVRMQQYLKLVRKIGPHVRPVWIDQIEGLSIHNRTLRRRLAIIRTAFSPVRDAKHHGALAHGVSHWPANCYPSWRG